MGRRMKQGGTSGVPGGGPRLPSRGVAIAFGVVGVVLVGLGVITLMPSVNDSPASLPIGLELLGGGGGLILLGGRGITSEPASDDPATERPLCPSWIGWATVGILLLAGGVLAVLRLPEISAYYAAGDFTVRTRHHRMTDPIIAGVVLGCLSMAAAIRRFRTRHRPGDGETQESLRADDELFAQEFARVAAERRRRALLRAVVSAGIVVVFLLFMLMRR